MRLPPGEEGNRDIIMRYRPLAIVLVAYLSACDLFESEELGRMFAIIPGEYTFEVSRIDMEERTYLLVSANEPYRLARDTIVNRSFWTSPQIVSCLSRQHCDELVAAHNAVIVREGIEQDHKVCSASDTTNIISVTECVTIGIAVPIWADNFFYLLERGIDSIGSQSLFKKIPGRCGYTWMTQHPLLANGQKAPREIMLVDTLRIVTC